MAQRNSEYSPSANNRRRLPLAATVWVGLAIIVVLVVASVLLIQALVVGINARAQGLGFDDLQTLNETDFLALFGIRGAFLSTLVQNVIWIVVPLVHIGFIRRESLSSIGFSARNLLVLIGAGFGLGFLALVVNFALGVLFTTVFDIRQDQAAQFSAILQADDVFGQVLFALLAVVVAPVGEEIVFRGYVFNAMRQNGGQGSLVLAYLVSAVLFSAIHLLNVTQGQLALVVPIFAVGLLFAAGMHLTNSLIPCIIAHAINNSLSTLALLFCINTNFPGCPV